MSLAPILVCKPLSLYQSIYRIVERIPYGKVISYGGIARIVGCSARQVGYAMAAIPYGQDLPWHRVVNSRGEVSPRKHGQGDSEQKFMLLSEGVLFDRKGRIDLDKHGWEDIHDADPDEFESVDDEYR